MAKPVWTPKTGETWITNFHHSGPFGYMSNFFMDPVPFIAPKYNYDENNINTLGNYEYIAPSAEHYYQAAKAVKIGDVEIILAANTPAEAKKIGRSIQKRSDWENIKVDVMRRVQQYKYRPNSRLAYKLLSTGNAVIVEGNYWGDDFWGCVQGQSGEWIGENWLGKLIMEQRTALRES